MDEKVSNRSLAQQRVQARRLRRRAIYESLAVVFFSFGMYVLIHERLHIALKIICGMMILHSLVRAIGDFDGYRRRMQTISEMETQR
jgi:hypothetical protein